MKTSRIKAAPRLITYPCLVESTHIREKGMVVLFTSANTGTVLIKGCGECEHDHVGHHCTRWTPIGSGDWRVLEPDEVITLQND